LEIYQNEYSESTLSLGAAISQLLFSYPSNAPADTRHLYTRTTPLNVSSKGMLIFINTPART